MPDHRRDLDQLSTRLAWLAAAVSSPRISRSLEKQILSEIRRVQKKVTAIQAFVLAEQRPQKVKRAKRVKREKVERVEVGVVYTEATIFNVEEYAERNII